MTRAIHRIGPFELLLLGRALGKVRFEGILHLRDVLSQRHSQVFFLGGAPVYCRTGDLLYSFAAHALRHEILPGDLVRDLLRRAEEQGVLLEELLVGEGYLTEDLVAEYKGALSSELFAATMGSRELDYRVQWTRPQFSSGALLGLDPWDAFFRTVASGAHPGFRGDYLDSRAGAPLRTTPALHPIVPRFHRVFGESATELVRLLAEARTAESCLLELGATDEAAAALFALLYPRLVVCDGLTDEPLDYDGLTPPAEVAPAPAAPALRSATAPSPAEAPPSPRPAAAAAPARPARMTSPGMPAAPAGPAVVAPPSRELPRDPHRPVVTLEAELVDRAGRDGPILELREGDAAPAPAGRPRDAELPEHGDASIEASLAEAAQRMRGTNAYRTLDVPPEAPFSQLRDAHQRLRRKYDVSQYRSFVLGQTTHALLQEIGQLLDRALKTLTDPRQRPAHDRDLGVGDGTLTEALRAAFQAEASFGTALKHLQSQDWDSAILAFRAAIDKNPNDGAYRAYLAWALHRAHPPQTHERAGVAATIWGELDKAVSLAPRLGLVNLLRARVARDEGDVERAIEAYQKVLGANPDHEEARKELPGLKEMAKGRSAKKGGLGGIFGRMKR